MSALAIAEQKKAYLDQAEDLIKRSEAEARGFTDEESTQYNSLINQAKNCTSAMEVSNKRSELTSLRGGLPAAPAPAPYVASSKSDHLAAAEHLRSLIFEGSGERMLHTPGLDAEACRALFYEHQYRLDRADFRRTVTESHSDLTYVTPSSIVPKIIEKSLFFSQLRPYCTVMPTPDGRTLTVPKGDATSLTAVIRTEGDPSGDATKPTVGQTQFYDYKYDSGEIYLTYESRRDALPMFEQFLTRSLALGVARKQNYDFTLGSGSGEPQGLVTAASDSGVVTASSSALSSDNMIDLANAIDLEAAGGPGQSELFYGMHQATLGYLQKLKDTTNRPLWQIDYVNGRPATFNGIRLILLSNMAQLGGAGRKVVICGNLRNFVIRDVGNPRFKVFDQTDACIHRDLVGFKMYSSADSRFIGYSNELMYLTTGA